MNIGALVATMAGVQMMMDDFGKAGCSREDTCKMKDCGNCYELDKYEEK